MAALVGQPAHQCRQPNTWIDLKMISYLVVNNLSVWEEEKKKRLEKVR